MVPEYVTNVRAPYQRRFWAIHDNRVRHLTMLERGVFDAVQAELWSVEGARVDEKTLVRKLRLGRKEKTALETLFADGLLKRDEDGMVFDEVQQQDWGHLLKVSLKGKKAAETRWAKAKGGPEGSPDKGSEESDGGSPDDF